MSLIEGADPLAITEHGLFFREADDCKVWGKGRVTLAGDAAHLATPALGQGTSQAIEDALALGRAIGKDGPTPEALRGYEACRQPQMDAVHRRCVRESRDFQAGRSTMKPQVYCHEMGIWRRELPPLRSAADATA